MRRHTCRSGVELLLAAAVVSGGCGDGLGPDPSLESPRAIVSNPVSPSVSLAGAAASRDGPGTAYVSLPPGSYPGGVSVTVTNRRTGITRTDALASGGLDPVPIEAEVEDTLRLAIDTAGTEPVEFDQVVPIRMLPVVVRTSPPAGKRDVPLNLRVLVVFSEPMDPASVTGASVRLELNGSPVPAAVAVSGTGLEATLIPEGDLQPESGYIIVVDDVRDTDGSGLATPALADFTTTAIGGNAVGLRFEREPGNAIAGLVMSAVTVVVVDAEGNPAVGFDGNITIGLGANPGGGTLSGTLRRFGGSGTATFSDLRVDRPGNGYSLVASSAGLSAASGVFDVVPGTDIIAFSIIDNSFLLDFRLYLIAADGRASAELDVGMWATSPDWSPDGSRIAFSRVAGGNVEWWENPDDVALPEDTIYIVNADGSGLVSLGETGGPVAWSPDGARLAYTKQVSVAGDTLSPQIHVMDADGSNIMRLGPGSTASWSPDGRRLAYAREDGIHIMNADGSGDVDLGRPGAVMPRWSPDGSKLLFYWWWREPEAHMADVYVMNADGSDLRNLTGGHGTHGHIAPSWSPDGRRIVYGATDDFGDTWALYMMNADGTGSALVPTPESITLDRGGGVRATAWSPR